MNLRIVRAAVTAAAAALLVCTTAFTSGMAVDLAATGLLHLPAAATTVIGALILGADGWLGVWLFRRAYAAERLMETDADRSGT